MKEPDFKAYKHYKYIVADQRLLDGKLAVRGTRFSVSFVLSLLAQGLSLDTIQDMYGAHVREAVPEVLRAAAQAVDVPSPAALTLAERVAEMAIPGLDKLTQWFGFFPSFHDAEVLSISLDREGPSRIAVYTWSMTNRVDDRGYYVLEKHVTVTFVLEYISQVNLDGFGGCNVLAGIFLERVPDGYVLTLNGLAGISGKFEFRHVSVEMAAGVLTRDEAADETPVDLE